MYGRRRPTAISLAEAARRAGMGRPIAFAQARKGRLPFPTVRVGGRIVVPARSFELWLSDQRRNVRSAGVTARNRRRASSWLQSSSRSVWLRLAQASMVLGEDRRLLRRPRSP
jgi:hypothetical protein